MVWFTLMLLAPAPLGDQEPSSPPMVVEVFDPGAFGRSLQHGPLGTALMDSELWSNLKDDPRVKAVEVGIGILLGPVNGEIGDFLDAMAGEGIQIGMTSETTWSLVARGRDGDLTEDCLRPLLGFVGVSADQIAGESWSIPVGQAQFVRRGDDFFLLPPDQQPPAEGTGIVMPKGYDAARAAANGAKALLFLTGEALRANGYERYPEDLGASLLAADLHEVARVAPWAATALHLEGGELALEAYAPCDEEVLASHAPFFPEVEAAAWPVLPGELMSGTMTRELGTWWTERDLYADESAVVESVEADGNFALLFGHDPGPEVFAHLEPTMHFVVAPLPQDEAEGLLVEFPGAAFGMRLREDAPEDLGSAFANAFIAAVTFANDDGGAQGYEAFVLGVEPHETGTLYTARLRREEGADSLPVRANLSPSMWMGNDGEIWMSTSAGLAQMAVNAPRAARPAAGIGFRVVGENAYQLLERNREAFIAQRSLKEGGDMEAAERYVDLVFAAAQAIEVIEMRSARDGDFFRVRLGVTAGAPKGDQEGESK